jgi:hypothetical protein
VSIRPENTEKNLRRPQREHPAVSYCGCPLTALKQRATTHDPYCGNNIDKDPIPCDYGVLAKGVRLRSQKNIGQQSFFCFLSWRGVRTQPGPASKETMKNLKYG